MRQKSQKIEMRTSNLEKHQKYEYIRNTIHQYRITKENLQLHKKKIKEEKKYQEFIAE